jgi:hypothetical protein
MNRADRLLEKQRAQSNAARTALKPKPGELGNVVRNFAKRWRLPMPLGHKEEALIATEEDGLVWLRRHDGSLCMVVNPTTFHALQEEARMLRELGE